GTRPFIERAGQTTDDDSRSWAGSGAHLGSRDRRHPSVRFCEKCRELLRSVRCRAKLGGQATADSHFQATQQASPNDARGGGQARAAISSRTGVDLRKRETEGQLEPRDSRGRAKARRLLISG